MKLLCSIAENIFKRTEVAIDDKTVMTMGTLLLGMVKAYTTSKKVRVQEDWVIDILRTYRSLIPRLEDVSSHIPFVSRLFGPTVESFSLFNLLTVRHALLALYSDLAAHPSSRSLLNASAVAMQNLMAMDPAVIDGRDFSRAMPVFQQLSSTNEQTYLTLSWSLVLGAHAQVGKTDRTMCTALIYELTRCLYDAELAIRTSASMSLKHLVSQIALWIGADGGIDVDWLDIMESSLLPGIRMGLKKSSDTVKKVFISLLSHIVLTFGKQHPSLAEEFPSLHCDLNFLHDDDPEKDFFENISHIQVIMALCFYLHTFISTYSISTATSSCESDAKAWRTYKSWRRFVSDHYFFPHPRSCPCYNASPLVG